MALVQQFVAMADGNGEARLVQLWDASVVEVVEARAPARPHLCCHSLVQAEDVGRTLGSPPTIHGKPRCSSGQCCKPSGEDLRDGHLPFPKERRRHDPGRAPFCVRFHRLQLGAV
eukprot:scaffold701_cov162-Pinguiococcus_pyrenoidosus.AAC.4